MNDDSPGSAQDVADLDARIIARAAHLMTQRPPCPCGSRLASPTWCLRGLHMEVERLREAASAATCNAERSAKRAIAAEAQRDRLRDALRDLRDAATLHPPGDERMTAAMATAGSVLAEEQ